MGGYSKYAGWAHKDRGMTNRGPIQGAITTGELGRTPKGIFVPWKTLNENHTVSHFSYAPHIQGPHFLTKMLEANILYNNFLNDNLSV